MFGKNEVVGKAFFKDAPKDQLLVTSRFYTLQGEGPFRGQPAFFIRLAKCNLSCSFCDTYFDSGNWMTFEDIFKDISNEITTFYAKRDMDVPYWAIMHPESKVTLVITGGEPSLQQNLVPFLNMANELFGATQIESNGISVLEGLPTKTTLVVSPKCLEKAETKLVQRKLHWMNSVNASSLLPEKEYIKEYKAVRYLTPNKEMLARADCLKFVMSAPEVDRFSPYSEVPDWAHKWARETGKQVFVSPMNIYKKEPQKSKELRLMKDNITIQERSSIDEVISFWEEGLLDMEANRRNHEYTAEYAMKYGFILNLQLQLYASLA